MGSGDRNGFSACLPSCRRRDCPQSEWRNARAFAFGAPAFLVVDAFKRLPTGTCFCWSHFPCLSMKQSALSVAPVEPAPACLPLVSRALRVVSSLSLDLRFGEGDGHLCLCLLFLPPSETIRLSSEALTFGDQLIAGCFFSGLGYPCQIGVTQVSRVLDLRRDWRFELIRFFELPTVRSLQELHI